MTPAPILLALLGNLWYYCRPSGMRDRYTITERLDHGGMAEVFRGVAESMEGFKKTVAIKRILPNLTKNKKFVSMFLDEARLSLFLQHANIVQVFDISKTPTTRTSSSWSTSTGATSRRSSSGRSRRASGIEVAHAIYIMIECCKALHYAHGLEHPETGEPLGIVHRDISPPNILISKNGEVKLVDFGLAKANSQIESTDPGVVKGKFSYLSPEAASGLEVDHRADVFAVGIILWEMLTGRRLFYGETDYQTVELVRQARVPSIAALNPEVEPELEAGRAQGARARSPTIATRTPPTSATRSRSTCSRGGMKVTVARHREPRPRHAGRDDAQALGRAEGVADRRADPRRDAEDDVARRRREGSRATAGAEGSMSLDPSTFVDTVELGRRAAACRASSSRRPSVRGARRAPPAEQAAATADTPRAAARSSRSSRCSSPSAPACTSKERGQAAVGC